MNKEIKIVLAIKGERHGGSHDIYVRGDTKETIPRHREIDERLAKAILKRNGLL